MNIPALSPGEKAQSIKRVTWVGAILNALLAILKIIAGMIGHSAALVADGIHSLSDLASDALVLLAAKHGAQPADSDHPYGHARFETAATVALGLLLAVVAVGIAWDAVERTLQTDPLPSPTLLAVSIAIASLVSKEWLYHYTLRTAHRIHSKLLEANAWHHRSDGISSAVVLIGVVGAMLGYPMMDAVAAFIVALMIGQIAWKLISNSVKELVDTAVDEHTLKQITQLISHTDGVVSLHMLRTRLMGSNILVDAHIQVKPRLSVSEGHHIAETVECLLKEGVENIQDVTIHIDPEDDQEAPINDKLPLRGELLTHLQQSWADYPEAKTIKDVTLHFLDGKVDVNIVLPLPEENIGKAREIQDRFSQLTTTHPQIASITVHFS